MACDHEWKSTAVNKRGQKRWKYTSKMESDIERTPVLKDNPKLHIDAMRVIEFYCYAHNVSYCQGMFEVLLPFLFMKQKTPDEEQNERDDATSAQ